MSKLFHSLKKNLKNHQTVHANIWNSVKEHLTIVKSKKLKMRRLLSKLLMTKRRTRRKLRKIRSLSIIKSQTLTKSLTYTAKLAISS